MKTKNTARRLDALFEGTVGLFIVLFFALIFMPTMKVFMDAIDSFEQLWFVIKNPSSIIPDKVTLAVDSDCGDHTCWE